MRVHLSCSSEKVDSTPCYRATNAAFDGFRSEIVTMRPGFPTRRRASVEGSRGSKGLIRRAWVGAVVLLLLAGSVVAARTSAADALGKPVKPTVSSFEATPSSLSGSAARSSCQHG